MSYRFMISQEQFSENIPYRGKVPTVSYKAGDLGKNLKLVNFYKDLLSRATCYRSAKRGSIGTDHSVEGYSQ